jgi:hypothetical protein
MVRLSALRESIAARRAEESVEKLYDNLDFFCGEEVFRNTFQGGSLAFEEATRDDCSVEISSTTQRTNLV